MLDVFLQDQGEKKCHLINCSETQLKHLQKTVIYHTTVVPIGIEKPKKLHS